jgi:hypothetical protein
LLAAATLEDPVYAYLFNVEEHGIEAEEHERNGCSEPPKGAVTLYVGVEPGTLRCPALGLMVVVIGVWCSEDEREDAGQGSEACNTSYSVVESECQNEIAEHGRVNYACDAGTTSHVTDREASSLWEPGGSD